MPKPAALLTLPNEILLHITHYIDGKDCDAKTKKNIQDWRLSTVQYNRSRTLRNLVLTCKELVPIGREALLDNIVISRPRLWQLLKFLIQHPDLLKKVIRIRVQSWGVCERVVEQALINQAALARTHTDVALKKLFFLLQQQCPTVRKTTDYMPLLLALCRNLREITLGTTCSTSTDVDRYSSPSPLLFELPSLFSSYWPSTLTNGIREKITVLDIMQEDFLWAEMHRSIDLKMFKNLQALSLPFLNRKAQAIYPEWTQMYRLNHTKVVLPQSLRSLTVYVNYLGASFLYGWLAPLFCNESSLRTLVSVKLYTFTPLQLHYKFMKDFQGTIHMSGLRNTVGGWKHSPVKFQTFFLPVMDYDSGNLENYVEYDWLLHLEVILQGKKLTDETRH